MDPSNLFLLFILIPSAFAIYAARAASGRSVPDKQSALEIAARELGLEPRDDGFARYIEGGHELIVTARREGRQLGERVTVCVRLREPITTELSIATNDVLAERKASTLRARGDAELLPKVSVSGDFDMYFRLGSRRGERARRMVKGALANLVLNTDRLGYQLELAHTQVTITARWVTMVEEVQRAVDAAVRLAKALIEAERRQPELVPWRVVAGVWDEAADRAGGEFDRESHLLTVKTPFGTLTGHPKSEREERWYAKLSLDLQRPLTMRIALTDEAARSLWQRWTSPDLVLGDGQFDAIFYVSSDEPEAARALLGEATRAALLELERHTAGISIDSKRIEVLIEGPRVTELEPLMRVLDGSIAAAEALERAARPSGQGAYR